MCAKNYENWLAVDKVMAKISILTFFCPPCSHHMHFHHPGANLLIACLIVRRCFWLEFIPSIEVKCPKPGLLSLIIGWGEWGKAVLKKNLLFLQCNQFHFIDSMLFFGQVKQFFGHWHCQNIFWAKMGFYLPYKNWQFFLTLTLSKYFSGKYGVLPPLQKLARMPMLVSFHIANV